MDTTGQYGLMCCIFTIVIRVNQTDCLKRELILAGVYQYTQIYVHEPKFEFTVQGKYIHGIYITETEVVLNSTSTRRNTFSS
jgi:hypothetical protein